MIELTSLLVYWKMKTGMYRAESRVFNLTSFQLRQNCLTIFFVKASVYKVDTNVESVVVSDCLILAY